MTVRTQPLAEITAEALSVLYREIGIVNTVRFVAQFTTGYGNYTLERDRLYADLTLDEIMTDIRRRRRQEDASA
jgi:hypothetical protein